MTDEHHGSDGSEQRNGEEFIPREEELDAIPLTAVDTVEVPPAVVELAREKADRYDTPVEEILMEYTRLEVQFLGESGEVVDDP